jgi:hypothetical protein
MPAAESASYWEKSRFVTSRLGKLFATTLKGAENEILIVTNLRQGLPMGNINVLAGALIEAWAQERLEAAFKGLEGHSANEYQLQAVENYKRGGLADIMLHFSRAGRALSADVDVKATAKDIKGAGQGSNLTSYAKIRSQYLLDPDYIFVVLALEHAVHSHVLADGRIESAIVIKSCSVFDLKALSERDITLNPALGHGQLQMRDMLDIEPECLRSAAEFCAILDAKFLAKNTEAKLHKLALKKGWLTPDLAVEAVEEASSFSI